MFIIAQFALDCKVPAADTSGEVHEQDHFLCSVLMNMVRHTCVLAESILIHILCVLLTISGLIYYCAYFRYTTDWCCQSIGAESNACSQNLKIKPTLAKKLRVYHTSCESRAREFGCCSFMIVRKGHEQFNGMSGNSCSLPTTLFSMQ